MILTVDLQLDGSKGDLNQSSARIRQSPKGDTKYYTQSNRFYAQKRNSVQPILPKHINK
jgi:hypothetical protein